MAVNKIFASTQSEHREREVPAGTQPGTPLLVGDRPAVTLTAAGGATVTETEGLPAGLTSITYANGGVGNLEDHASVAFDGTFEFDVAGADADTESDVEVFLLGDGSLSLTDSGTDDHFGWTDYPRDYRKVAGRAPVRIGA